jgi:hypothetical protein
MSMRWISSKMGYIGRKIKKFQWGSNLQFKRAVVGARNFLKSSDRVHILHTRIIRQNIDKLLI